MSSPGALSHDRARILVIRRDNIGDLVLTTPLLAALRRRFPQAWLGALVNSYNAPVLERNPNVDAVIAYTKLKHLGSKGGGEGGAFAALASRLASLARLRLSGLDYVVLAAPTFSERLLNLARWLAPRRIVGFSDGSRAARRLDLSVPLSQAQGLHEVERVFLLAAHFGIAEPIPPLTLVPDPGEVRRAPQADVAIHISARRPAQRWPAERFVSLIERIDAPRVTLLWSPGAADHPQHPGDDAKAAEIARRCGARARPYRTERLAELIGALAAAERAILSDGGAMHLAAALGKPMVALFGDSPVDHWRPWGVRHELVRPASRNLADLTVDEVLDAWRRLSEKPLSSVPGCTPAPSA